MVARNEVGVDAAIALQDLLDIRRLTIVNFRSWFFVTAGVSRFQSALTLNINLTILY